MASNRSGFVYQHPDPAGAAAGGAAAAGQQQAAFADAGAARTFLSEYVNDADFLKAVPDDKVMPWAGHVKQKVEGFGKQFPADWRQQVAGENAEHLKTLERFQSPKALYDSYASLRSKMASGELKAQIPFPATGTPEQQAAWRVDAGVPDKPEAYDIKLPEGVVLGDEDKPFVEAWKKHAHGKNMKPEHVTAGVEWFLQNREAQAETRSNADAEFKLNSEDTLRSEWGPDYRPNVNRIGAFLDTAPKGVKETIMGGRGPDGKPLGSHPDVLRWLVDLSRQLNPAGVLLPGAGGNLATSVADEISKIEKVMRDDRRTYDKDEKMQARLRELYSARDQIGQRKAA